MLRFLVGLRPLGTTFFMLRSFRRAFSILRHGVADPPSDRMSDFSIRPGWFLGAVDGGEGPDLTATDRAPVAKGFGETDDMW